jgi:carboxypeptidase family protein
MHHSPKVIASFVFLLAFTPILSTVWAQGPVGTLNGTILDQSGAVVPGATVIAVNNATAVESKTTSTSAGAYTLPYLPSGTYTIRVSAPGFRTSTAENVILRVAQDLTVNIKLEVGQVSQEVTVSDTPPLLDTGSAEIGRYISVEEYKSWPILLDDGQRQIQEFIFNSLPGTSGNTFKGSINGGQEYSHEILIEGIPVGRSDLSGGNNNEFSPSAEAISEFKLQTGAISAQYNGGQTAVANFTIKSGTNNLHGSAFYYNQNEALNANDLYDKTVGNKRPKFREHNYGYSVGGPVYIPKVYNGRNKTFFFTNLEHTKYNDLSYSGFTTLATKDFKSGDFSRLLDPNFTGNSSSGTQIGTDALGRPIIFGQIYDPRTTRTVGGQAVRDPFPGNIIPQSAWDPVAKNVIQNVGLVDPLYNTMLRNTPKVSDCCPFFDLHIVGVKVDHNISEKHRLSAYYNRSYRDRNNNGGSRYLPIPGPPTSSWQEQITPGHMGRLALTSTLTPSLENRVAAGYNRFRNENGAPPGTVNKDWASKIGLQDLPGTMFPVFSFSGPGYQGGSIARMGVGFVDDSANGSTVIQDDLTWIKGKHSFRFGYQYARYFYNDKSLSDAGSFRFTPRSTDLPGYLDSTGHAFASFLLGAANNAGHGITELTSAHRQPYHAFYFADDWKVNPKLTVNYGLRWEVIPPFFERTGRMSEINLNTPNPGADNRPGALVFGSRFNDTYWREFGPRLGLAYQVSGKLVLRAGYAMTNTPPIANDWGYGGFTFGFNGNSNVVGGTSPTGFVDDPAIYLSQPYPPLQGVLPNTDPSQVNYCCQVATVAKDSNRPGYVQNYSLTVQYQLPRQTVLEVAFIGNKGTRLWGAKGVFSEYDGLPSKLLSMGDVLNDPVSMHPQFLPYPDFPTDLTVATALKPYPQFFGVEEQFPYNTNSNYNSLQVTATKHLSKGLGFLAAYTWSKAIGYVDANGPGAYYATVQDYYNRKLERSVTEFNHPQDFKLTWVYETPVGKGRNFDLHWANWVLGGWQLAAIHHFVSGDPIAIAESGLLIPDGIGFGIRPDVVAGQKSTVGGAPSKVDVFNGVPYLNPAAFSLVPQTTNGTPLRVGTAPRFLPNVRGPHGISETFRMSKKFPFSKREGTFFGLGMTMDNPLNRTCRYINSTDITDPTFGMLYAGCGGRTIQLDARVEF